MAILVGLMICDKCGMHTCDASCPFELAGSWQGDYTHIGSGKMALSEHRLRVARWILHHEMEFEAPVIEWARLMLGTRETA